MLEKRLLVCITSSIFFISSISWIAICFCFPEGSSMRLSGTCWIFWVSRYFNAWHSERTALRKACSIMPGACFSVSVCRCSSPRKVSGKKNTPVRSFLIKGFRNKDIACILYPDIKDPKKKSSKTSRTLKKLRNHGLIKNSKIKTLSYYIKRRA